MPSTELPSRMHGFRILVCLDRSVASEASLPYVVAVAKAFDSSVTLVHVMEPPRHDHPGPQMSDVLEWEIARREANVALEHVQREVEQALEQPVETRLEQGHPAERIVDVAREVGADLIVLTSHGVSSTRAAILGSTAQRVLALARTSVFVVHPSSAGEHIQPKRLLVPLDGSPRTESILPTAARMARAFRADLLLVHVVQEPVPTLVLSAAGDIALARELASHLESAARCYLERLRDRLAHDATSVHTLVVRHANERQALLDVSRHEGVGIIVLSAHGSACDPVHPFGSVTTDLLTYSELPTLVLQDLPERDWPLEPDPHHSSAPPLRASYTPEGE